MIEVILPERIRLTTKLKEETRCRDMYRIDVDRKITCHFLLEQF